MRSIKSATWRSVSQFHYLEDKEILSALADDAKILRACQVDAQSSYMVLTVPESSEYRNVSAIDDLVQSLKNLGIAPKLYKASGSDDVQIFLSFSTPVKTEEMATALRPYLQKVGFLVAQGKLIVHTDEPFAIPLQSGFCWLNDLYEPKLKRDEISLMASMAFFLRDLETNTATPETILDALQKEDSESTQILSQEQLSEIVPGLKTTPTLKGGDQTIIESEMPAREIQDRVTVITAPAILNNMLGELENFQASENVCLLMADACEPALCNFETGEERAEEIPTVACHEDLVELTKDKSLSGPSNPEIGRPEFVFETEPSPSLITPPPREMQALSIPGNSSQGISESSNGFQTGLTFLNDSIDEQDLSEPAKIEKHSETLLFDDFRALEIMVLLATAGIEPVPDASKLSAETSETPETDIAPKKRKPNNLRSLAARKKEFSPDFPTTEILLTDDTVGWQLLLFPPVISAKTDISEPPKGQPKRRNKARSNLPESATIVSSGLNEIFSIQ